MQELKQRTGDMEDKIVKLEEEKRVLQEELEDVLKNGMKAPLI